MDQSPAGKPKSKRVQIIKRPNLLLEKIGGIEAVKKLFGPAVLKRIESAIESQADDFADVIDGYVHELNQLTQDAAVFDRDVIEKVRSVSHELRGISGTFGLHLVTRVAKSLWNFLGEFDEPSPVVHNIVRMHVDTLLAAYSKGAASDGDAVARQVEAGLQSVVNKFRAAQ